MTKKLICLFNGLLDIPLQCLEGKTPLERAHTPHLDELFSFGHCNCYDKEYRVEKYDALSLALGYELPLSFLSQAILKALCIGLSLREGQWAFSFRFVSTAKGVLVEAKEDLASFQEAKELCKLLNKQAKKHQEAFYLMEGGEGIFVGSDPKLYPSLWGRQELMTLGYARDELLPGGKENTPLIEKLNSYQKILELSEINVLREDLEVLPVNDIMVWGGGTRLPDFDNDFSNASHFIYSADPCTVGLAKYLNINCRAAPMEKEAYDHLRYFSSQFKSYISCFDTLILDIDYLWPSTLKGDVREKIKRIEYLDRYWIAPMLKRCEQEGVEMVVMGIDRADIHQGKRVQGDAFYLSSRNQQGTRKNEGFDEKALAGIDKKLLLSSLRVL